MVRYPNKRQIDLFPTTHFFISLSANLSITLNLKCILANANAMVYYHIHILCIMQWQMHNVAKI